MPLLTYDDIGYKVNAQRRAVEGARRTLPSAAESLTICAAFSTRPRPGGTAARKKKTR